MAVPFVREVSGFVELGEGGSLVRRLRFWRLMTTSHCVRGRELACVVMDDTGCGIIEWMDGWRDGQGRDVV